MKEPMAKASSLTRTTWTPDPAAERSFARTASISEPSRLVRSFATPTATSTSVARTSRQNDKRGKSVPTRSAEVDAEERRAADVLAVRRNQVGVAEPDRFERDCEREGDHGDREPADAQRGQADDDPDDGAPRARPASGAIGNGTFQLSVSGPRRKPATPASVSCASDT